MRDYYNDNNLRDEFEKLIQSIGRDITENNLRPLIASEFKEVTTMQRKFIEDAKSDAVSFSKDANKTLETLITQALDGMSRYRDTIVQLNDINNNIISKIQFYFENSDVVSTTSKLYEYSKAFDDYIHKSIEACEVILSENKEYLKQLEVTVKDLDKSVPQNNKKIDDIVIKVQDIYEGMKNNTAVIDRRLIESFSDFAARIEQLKTSLASESSSIDNGIKAMHSMQKEANDSQKKMEKQIENAQNLIIANMNQIHYVQK